MHGRDARGGLTLIEVIAVMAVLGIGVLGLASLISNILTTTTGTQMRGVAVDLARQELERIRSLKYTRIGVGQGTASPSNLGFLDVDGDGYDLGEAYFMETLPASILPGGKRWVLVEAVDDPVDGMGANDADGLQDTTTGQVMDYKKVTVKVSWTGEQGGTSEIAVVSYVHGDVLADDPPSASAPSGGADMSNPMGGGMDDDMGMGMGMEEDMGMGGTGMGDDMGAAMGMGEDSMGHPDDED